MLGKLKSAATRVSHSKLGRNVVKMARGVGTKFGSNKKKGAPHILLAGGAAAAKSPYAGKKPLSKQMQANFALIAADIDALMAARNSAVASDLKSDIKQNISDLLATQEIQSDPGAQATLQAWYDNITQTVHGGDKPTFLHIHAVAVNNAKDQLRKDGDPRFGATPTPPQTNLSTLNPNFGSGAINTVYLVKDQNGNTYIFKPDQLTEMEVLKGQGSDPSAEGTSPFSNRAVGTKAIDGLLGFGLVPTTDFATHDGMTGHIMGLAQGGAMQVGVPSDATSEQSELWSSDSSFAPSNAHYVPVKGGDGKPVLGDDGKPVKKWIVIDNVATNPDLSRSDVQQEMSNLHILDIITGQVDRHSGNYLINQNESGQAELGAFDNDGAFGANHEKIDAMIPGTHLPGAPPLVSQDQADAINSLSKEKIQNALDGLLSQQEIDSTVTRWETLKNMVNDGTIKTVPGYDQGTHQVLTDPSNADNSYVGVHHSQQQDASQSGTQTIPFKIDSLQSTGQGGQTNQPMQSWSQGPGGQGDGSSQGQNGSDFGSSDTSSTQSSSQGQSQNPSGGSSNQQSSSSDSGSTQDSSSSSSTQQDGSQSESSSSPNAGSENQGDSSQTQSDSSQSQSKGDSSQTQSDSGQSNDTSQSKGDSSQTQSDSSQTQSDSGQSNDTSQSKGDSSQTQSDSSQTQSDSDQSNDTSQSKGDSSQTQSDSSQTQSDSSQTQSDSSQSQSKGDSSQTQSDSSQTQSDSSQSQSKGDSSQSQSKGDSSQTQSDSGQSKGPSDSSQSQSSTAVQAVAVTAVAGGFGAAVVSAAQSGTSAASTATTSSTANTSTSSSTSTTQSQGSQSQGKDASTSDSSQSKSNEQSSVTPVLGGTVMTAVASAFGDAALDIKPPTAPSKQGPSPKLVKALGEGNAVSSASSQSELAAKAAELGISPDLFKVLGNNASGTQGEVVPLTKDGDIRNETASILNQLSLLKNAITNGQTKFQSVTQVEMGLPAEASMTPETLAALKTMTADELAALVGYTSGDYSKLTGAMRGAAAKTDATGATKQAIPSNLVNYMKLVDQALKKLPDYKGSVYRGVDASKLPSGFIKDKYGSNIGKSTFEMSFTSTTTDMATASHFAKTTMIHMEVSQGKDISGISIYQNEKEVLLRPTTEVKVVKVTKPDKDGIVHISLKEGGSESATANQSTVKTFLTNVASNVQSFFSSLTSNASSMASNLGSPSSPFQDALASNAAATPAGASSTAPSGSSPFQDALASNAAATPSGASSTAPSGSSPFQDALASNAAATPSGASSTAPSGSSPFQDALASNAAATPSGASSTAPSGSSPFQDALASNAAATPAGASSTAPTGSSPFQDALASNAAATPAGASSTAPTGSSPFQDALASNAAATPANASSTAPSGKPSYDTYSAPASVKVAPSVINHAISMGVSPDLLEVLGNANPGDNSSFNQDKEPSTAAVLTQVASVQKALADGTPTYKNFKGQTQTIPADMFTALQGLTPDQLTALIGYTGGDYSKLNAALRQAGKKPMPPKLQAYVALVDQALAQLPNYVGDSHRGVAVATAPLSVLNKYINKLDSGGAIVESAFTSTSTSEGVANQYLEGMMIHFSVTHGKSVSPISMYPREKEVILAPSTAFTITKTETLKGVDGKDVVHFYFQEGAPSTTGASPSSTEPATAAPHSPAPATNSPSPAAESTSTTQSPSSSWQSKAPSQQGTGANPAVQMGSSSTPAASQTAASPTAQSSAAQSSAAQSSTSQTSTEQPSSTTPQSTPQSSGQLAKSVQELKSSPAWQDQNKKLLDALGKDALFDFSTPEEVAARAAELGIGKDVLDLLGNNASGVQGETVQLHDDGNVRNETYRILNQISLLKKALDAGQSTYKTYNHLTAPGMSGFSATLSPETSAALKKLSGDELAALVGYTSGDYTKLNGAMRGAGSKTDSAGATKQAIPPKVLNYMKLADQALAKLPDFKGETFRGVDASKLPADFIKNKYTSNIGKSTFEFSFTSTTTSESAAKHFAKTTMIHMDVSTGKDISGISMFEHEKEVLLRPTTEVKIVKAKPDKEGILHVYLKEVPAATPLR